MGTGSIENAVSLETDTLGACAESIAFIRRNSDGGNSGALVSRPAADTPTPIVQLTLYREVNLVPGNDGWFAPDRQRTA